MVMRGKESVLALNEVVLGISQLATKAKFNKISCVNHLLSLRLYLFF
jgi:hypothetical protein